MAKTVDFGIDLGTTNSAIARMSPKGAEIIPVRRLNYIPSAVAMDRNGAVKVGADALNPTLGHARWFKRLMGTSNTLPLTEEIRWTPEELSAEVLKALKAAAKLKTDEDIVDVVITVPAMFSQPQCAATNEAAKLAGLNAVALLQEPIAAATAYLSDAPIDGNYLIYDLGGGTFDVSVIRLRNGEMNVIGHGGDNYLGGADFDRTVFDWVLQQIAKQGGDTSIFESRALMHRLLIGCEDARIALSDTDSTTIYLDEFDLPVAKVELSRQILEDLLDSLVSKTIEIAHDRIKAASLEAADIQSVLLVGGPTQMPLIRQRLKSELGISLNLDQDPMTVVAKGAAIHAGSLLKDQGTKSPSQSRTVEGQAQLDLYYDPVSPTQETSISGKVSQPVGFEGEVKLTISSGDWETGWIPLRNSAFGVELRLGRTPISEFQIELRDKSGNAVATNVPSFTIQSGIRAAQAVTPYSYGVVLEGGSKVRKLMDAGQPLPANGFHEFRLAKSILAGSDEYAMIYFVEGDSSHADENCRVGHLKIDGQSINRTLRENERLEIKLKMDEARLLTASIYVPVLDEEFKVQLRPTFDSPDPEDLKAALVETQLAISSLEDQLTEEEQDRIIRAQRQIEQLEATIERVEKGEIGEAKRIHKQLSDAKTSIRPLIEKYELSSKYNRAKETINDASEICTHFEDRMGLAKLNDLSEDVEKAYRLQQEATLENIQDRASDIFWSHYVKTRDCWEECVRFMRERSSLASNQLAFQERVHMAERALAENDFEGVRIHFRFAQQFLPSEDKLRNRFFDASIR